MQLTAFFEKETHAKTENVVPPAASNGNETETLSVPAPPMKTNPAHGSMMDFVRKNYVLRAEVCGRCIQYRLTTFTSQMRM